MPEGTSPATLLSPACRTTLIQILWRPSMSGLSMNTRVRLSVINGLITGAIAAWFYANAAGRGGDLWRAMHFHPLNYLAMILVCCFNTFAFFGMLDRCIPIKRWKGFLLGGMVALVGSFLCSLVMGIRTGRVGELLFGTAFFFPVSLFVGAIAGLVLAYIVRDQGEKA